MRLVGAALLLVLSSAVALADDAKPADPKPAETKAHVPLRVVRMLPDAEQALLYDKTKGTYVAVEAGQAVEGFTVDSVDDDEVTLISDAGATVVLAAPARHRRTAEAGNADDGDSDGDRPVKHRARATRVAAAEPSTEPKPADPYATEGTPADPYASNAAGQPSDPYGSGVQAAPAGSIGTGADGVRVVDVAAPAIGTGADGVRVVDAAAPAPRASVAAPVAVPAPAAVAAPAPASVTVTVAVPTAAPAPVAVAAPAAVSAPAAVPAPAPVAAPAPAPIVASAPVTKPAPLTKAVAHKPADGAAALAAALTGDDAVEAAPAAPSIILSRADVKTALSNFGAMSRAVQGEFTADGLRIDGVAAGSLFAKAGLQAGDVVTSVDGKPLRSLDDAANLYARASKAKVLTAQVLRDGKPVALRVAIQ